MLLDDGFDLPQLHAEAANIDSAVNSPSPFDVSVGQISPKLAGSIEPIGRIVGKRIAEGTFH